MNKISTLALSMIALSAMNVYADDFTVLATPADVLKYSIEDVDGAKETFRAVIENASSTEAEITAAMQAYEKTATPAPGYAFDMSFLLHYNAVTAENLGVYSQANLAATWKTDVPELSFNTKNTLAAPTSKCMRVDNQTGILNAEASYEKYIVYQTVELTAGAYQLNADAYVKGLANAATLSAGTDANSSKITGGGALKPYSVNFNVTSTEDVKLGFKRNSTEGNLTTVYFNNMYLYKVSSIIVITDDATGALAAAENVDVQLNRTFNAEEYYPICLPFVVENWREVFDDLLLLNTFTDKEQLSFKTLAGENTQARKPYLVKMKDNITEDNYLVFKNVKIEKANPGSWPNATDNVTLVGNWAAGTVPADSYYFSDGKWVRSDGNEPIVGFSAYINAATPLSADTLPMLINGKGNDDVSTGIEDIFSTENSIVNVYNLQGIIVKRGVSEENALDGLARGIYIVNGKKIVK